MARYIVVSGCEIEINKIVDYIAEDNVGAAVAFYDRLKAVFQLIAENPTIGRRRSDLSEGLRGVPFGRYVIFYRVWGSDVAIVRVLHGSRDLSALFHSDHDWDE